MSINELEIINKGITIPTQMLAARAPQAKMVKNKVSLRYVYCFC